MLRHFHGLYSHRLKLSTNQRARIPSDCKIIIGNLRKKGYTQGKMVVLFKAIVLPEIVYGLSVYPTSVSDLSA